MVSSTGETRLGGLHLAWLRFALPSSSKHVIFANNPYYYSPTYGERAEAELTGSGSSRTCTIRLHSPA